MVLNLRSLQDAVRRGLRALQGAATTYAAPGRGPSPGRTAPGSGTSRMPAAVRGGASSGGVYPGDFQGRLSIRYAPRPDGEPDPGEVVWAWVPYEEDHTRGKDRPVLLVGRSGSYLLGVMLTSKDRVPESAISQDYVELGAGAWDRQGRASEARLDRIVQLRPDGIRREGAVLDRARFENVAAGLRRRHGWK